MSTEHTGNTSLFAIFALSIYTLFLICYSLYQCYNGKEPQADPEWSKTKQRPNPVLQFVKRVFCRENLGTFVVWGVWFALFYYVSYSSQGLKPFDPYDILALEQSATLQEIKKAYRQLSLKYHPDKNPDPAAAVYFAEYIVKAYKALTDDTARENFDKYGHPDGPQPLSMGVALPEWLFNKDNSMAPLMLMVLVGCGILLPLSMVSWHMLSSDQYEGPNRIMKGTYYNFLVDPKSRIKESMGIGRIPDTLVTAAEFIQLPTFAAQEPLVDDVWKAIMHAFPEYKDKKGNFWKRKGSVVKAHLLLLAYLERQLDDIPQPLRQDLNFVLQKSPLLLEEMVKISFSPNPPHGYGWLAPAVASIEMLQSVIQAVPVSQRKAQGRALDNPATVLQLPHMDGATVKALRNKNKIKSLQDLQDLSPKERTALLRVVGLSLQQAEEVDAFIAALPTLALVSECGVDGEDAIYEQDIVKCTVKVLLSRPNHLEKEQLGNSKARPAVTSTYPLPYEESWYFMLADTTGNWVMAFKDKVALLEAEAASFKLAKSSLVSKTTPPPSTAAAVRVPAGADFDTAQTVELMFMAPRAGRYDLTLMCMSECYIGCDAHFRIQLRVLPQTRAMAEGRVARQQAAEDAPAAAAVDDDDDVDKDKDEEDGSDEEDEEEEEYDSEESGEEETDDES